MKGKQIGVLARELTVPIETIRYYERCGLMDKPARTEGNYRVYASTQIEQLRFIINCRHLDMEHEEIRGLLKLRVQPPEDCGEVNAIIDGHITHIDQRIAELRKLSRQLHKLRESCNVVSTLGSCRIMGALSTTSSDLKRASHAAKRTHGKTGKPRGAARKL